MFGKPFHFIVADYESELSATPAFRIDTDLWVFRPGNRCSTSKRGREFKWGNSAEEVRKFMLARPDVTLDSETPEKLTYTGGTLVNEPVKSWEFHFANGKLDRVDTFLTPTNAMETYHSLCKAIFEKYRKAAKEEGRGVHRASYWHYFMAKHEWFIACDVNTGGIRLLYEDKPQQSQSSIPASTKKEL